MRITGGGARGIILRVPKGDIVRPATDGMRQAVFSSLAARVPGAVFLDLFAGSGAYGLEAVSRGAESGLFVEKSTRAIDCIRKNMTAVCKSVGREVAGIRVAQTDALAHLQRMDPVLVDLVFIDPPYEIISKIAAMLFSELTRVLSEKTDPVVVFEMPGELTLNPPGWLCVKRLGKGARQPTVAFFRKQNSVGSVQGTVSSLPDCRPISP